MLRRGSPSCSKNHSDGQLIFAMEAHERPDHLVVAVVPHLITKHHQSYQSFPSKVKRKHRRLLTTTYPNTDIELLFRILEDSRSTSICYASLNGARFEDRIFRYSWASSYDRGVLKIDFRLTTGRGALRCCVLALLSTEPQCPCL